MVGMKLWRSDSGTRKAGAVEASVLELQKTNSSTSSRPSTPTTTSPGLGTTMVWVSTCFHHICLNKYTTLHRPQPSNISSFCWRRNHSYPASVHCLSSSTPPETDDVRSNAALAASLISKYSCARHLLTSLSPSTTYCPLVIVSGGKSNCPFYLCFCDLLLFFPFPPTSPISLALAIAYQCPSIDAF